MMDAHEFCYKDDRHIHLVNADDSDGTLATCFLSEDFADERKVNHCAHSCVYADRMNYCQHAGQVELHAYV